MRNPLPRGRPRRQPLAHWSPLSYRHGRTTGRLVAHLMENLAPVWTSYFGPDGRRNEGFRETLYSITDTLDCAGWPFVDEVASDRSLWNLTRMTLEGRTKPRVRVDASLTGRGNLVITFVPDRRDWVAFPYVEGGFMQRKRNEMAFVRNVESIFKVSPWSPEPSSIEPDVDGLVGRDFAAMILCLQDHCIDVLSRHFDVIVDHSIEPYNATKVLYEGRHHFDTLVGLVLMNEYQRACRDNEMFDRKRTERDRERIEGASRLLASVKGDGGAVGLVIGLEALDRRKTDGAKVLKRVYMDLMKSYGQNVNEKNHLRRREEVVEALDLVAPGWRDVLVRQAA